jgi:hypothetical protein
MISVIHLVNANSFFWSSIYEHEILRPIFDYDSSITNGAHPSADLLKFSKFSSSSKKLTVR